MSEFVIQTVKELPKDMVVPGSRIKWPWGTMEVKQMIEIPKAEAAKAKQAAITFARGTNKKRIELAQSHGKEDTGTNLAFGFRPKENGDLEIYRVA